jgi:RNA polymerase sigma factor (TIGR02999 family)
MPTPSPHEITELLAAAQSGDADAHAAVTRVVYRELHGLAEAYLRRERNDHTLQPTALVHEAYLRLIGQGAPWRNRAHFFGIAAQTMRRILVDHARRTTADRRDRTLLISLDDVPPDTGPTALDPAMDVLGVHEALAQLERVDPRQARVVELKFFVGLSLAEIAELLEISVATVSREWSMARVWLHERLSED